MKSLTKRLFLAADLPSSHLDLLSALRKELIDKNLFKGTFVQPHQLHLTLKFLGNISTEQIKPILKTLQHLKSSPLDISFGKLEFNPGAHPRVLWIPVSSEQLTHFVSQIEEALDPFCPKEKRPFHGHITLSRIRDPINRLAIEPELSKIVSDLPPLTLTDMTFYESELLAEGPRHTKLATLPFKKESS